MFQEITSIRLLKHDQKIS